MSDSPRVLELGRGIATAWAARLLADAGADVVKVEPPEGDPARALGPFPSAPPDRDQSGLFVALNINKRGVTLNIESPGEHTLLAALLAWADIAVLDFAPAHATRMGLDVDSLRTRYPQLVILSVTPFGSLGPRADYHATELTMAHGGGWASLCPATSADPELEPLKVHGHQCALMTGIAGAMTALAVYREARSSGVGEYIDLAEQAYVACVVESGIPVVGYRNQVPFRYHPRSLLPWRIFHAEDAPVFLVCVEQDQWERLVVFMGNPEWAQLEIFADMASRAANQDVLHGFMQEFIGGWQAMALFHAAQEHRICIAPVLDYAQLRNAVHLRERNFVGTIAQPGWGDLALMNNPVLTQAGRAALARPAPALGEHNQLLQDLKAASTPMQRQAAQTRATASPRLPLAGVRVVDLSWAWAGPFAAMNLAHLGADVIRLESSTRPDLYRRLPIYAEELEPGLNRSGMFNQWNQGKRSVTVALNTAEGKQLVRDFVANSDVVVQNFATGVLDRLGLGYAALREVNPRIILASISGYGQTGPWRNYMAYGPAAAALSGLCAVTGYVGGGPEELGLSMPDPTSGITAAYGIVAALARRDRTNQGDHVDVSLWEATAALGMEAWMQQTATGESPERLGNRDLHMAPHGCYRCLGPDAWVSIACRDDAQWQRLSALIDPALAADVRFRTVLARKQNERELDRLITQWTVEQDRWLITRLLQALGIAAFPSQSCRDLIDDPHLNARGFIERLAHPEVGARPHAGIPWRFSARGNGVQSPAPCIGVDTDEALRDVAGYSESKIASLRAAGVLQ